MSNRDRAGAVTQRDPYIDMRLLYHYEYHVSPQEFDAAGAIQRENVWIDLGAIMRQLPQD